ELLAALTRSLDRRSDISLMRGAFEETLRHIVAVRTIQLREAGSRWANRPGVVCEPESIALEVPGTDPAMPGLLEATFDPGCCLGEWDFQMLGLAAHVGALVLEIERSRLQLIRAGLLNSSRVRRDGAAPLIGSTMIMQTLRSTIERVAATDFTVLIEGESGVGKELVARQIHDLSRRRNGPFVAINCAALVETLLEAELFGIEDRTATGVRGRRGKFEAADGGTLFLDEVSDLSLSAQAKLLRAIQDLAIERVGGQGAHRVDIRIVAATNRSLSGLIERAVALTESEVIELDDLPPKVRGEYAEVLGPSLRRDDTLRTWASRYARLVLVRCRDNKREACRVLGISYHTLQAYLRYPATDPGWSDTDGPMAERSSDEACLDTAEQAI